jgi:hypothetical protein
MVGRKWESAEGTVVATEVAVQTQAGYEDRLRYVVDVRPASGDPFRTTLEEPKFIRGGFAQPGVGAVIGVLFDPKSNKAKFDTSDPRINLTRGGDAAQAAFDAAASASPGTAPPATGLGGFAGVQVLDGAEASQVADALRAAGVAVPGQAEDDPAARLAQLDDLKAKGLVSEAEYAEQRQKIIGSV